MKHDIQTKIASTVMDVASDYVDVSQNRAKSWTLCRKAFGRKSIDTEALALNLGFYLASWGMYRGSSVLLKYNYKVHEPVVMILRDKRYFFLYFPEIENLQLNVEPILELSDRIRLAYQSQLRNQDSGASISDTLTTKILLGTMCCSPAFDRYFREGCRTLGLPRSFNTKTLSALFDFYQQYERDFETIRANLLEDFDLDFPPMKILDMFLWGLGRIEGGAARTVTG